ncbi:MAG: PLP-dependent aminotransferase family protein [Rubrivivax sp.]
MSRRADRTLAEQLAGHFAERIRQRLLLPGARLPSVRECARRHGLSPSTVVAAYDRLLAAGIVEARKQRGFFVRETLVDRAGESARRGPGPREPRPPLPVSATTLIRGMFQPPGAMPMPGLGTLPVDWLDLPLLASALHKVSRGAALGDCSLRYGEPAGDASLRQALVRKLAEIGVSASPQQLITTVGATQALDVVTRTLLRAGDSVLVDEPGWAVEYARLAALGLRVLPVPRGEEGPDLAVMQRLIEAHQPRLYVTVSVLHNPTGASLSLHRAHQLLQLAERHGLHIVEDDTYAHLASPHLPRLAALDGLQRTFYVSGFSKILAPNWRVGYLAAPAHWVERLVDTKLLSTLTTPALTERALAHCLEQGLLRRHVERVMQRLELARARTVEAAEEQGMRFAAPPRGLFGWVDTGCDTERLAEALLDQGWLIAPGALFHAVPRPTTLMRVNFATTQAPAFWRSLRQTCAHILAP